MAYVIKRYSNRKLYDTQESRYVTLEELEEMIRAGKEIRVLDAATGEDLTSVTLAQILLENERTHRAALPTAFLHQLIKHGEAWQEFVQRSLRASLEGITTSQREADRIFREWAARAGWVQAKEREPEVRKSRAESEEPESLRDEIVALKEKLRALEERLPRKRKKS
ncbi:MAG: transcriptional regulator [Candidatus Rokubacteria bacterium]|nr:transcriptional regulator [Candidatus Rokubacteria bacterium]